MNRDSPDTVVVPLTRNYCAWGRPITRTYLYQFPSQEWYEKSLNWLSVTPLHKLRCYLADTGWRPRKKSEVGSAARMCVTQKWAWQSYNIEKKRIAEEEARQYKDLIMNAMDEGILDENHQ